MTPSKNENKATDAERDSGDPSLQDLQFRDFVEHANDIIFTLDLTGVVKYVSPNVGNALGLPPSSLTGKHFIEVVHPSDLDACTSAFQSVIEKHCKLIGIEYRIQHGDGHWSWQSSTLGPIFNAQGQLIAVIGVGRDINEQKKAEELLRLSEVRYRTLSENARDVIWTMAPDGAITHVSPSVEQTRGFTPEAAMRQSIEQILPPESLERSRRYFLEMLEDIAAGRPTKPFRGQLEYYCRDGSTYWCEVLATPILAEDGSLVELLGVSRDISEHKQYENELKQARDSAEALNRALEAANARLLELATIDTLTGLANRRHFDIKITQEMIRADRYKSPLSVLLFDIDHFKSVNDTYGHLVGDQVLQQLAKRAELQIRVTDILFRWGGEEFMLLMPNTGIDEAMVVAQKLRASFASRPIVDALTITASFGLAAYTANEPLTDWLRRVDDALYEAKNSGRNTVKIAPPLPPVDTGR